MTTECLVITIIIFTIVLVFLRARRKRYAFGVLPLMLVPVAYLIGQPISRLIVAGFALKTADVMNVIIILSLVIACIMFGFLSNGIELKRTRAAYFILCGGFTLI